jgi:hypothetical protein
MPRNSLSNRRYVMDHLRTKSRFLLAAVLAVSACSDEPPTPPATEPQGNGNVEQAPVQQGPPTEDVNPRIYTTGQRRLTLPKPEPIHSVGEGSL